MAPGSMATDRPTVPSASIRTTESAPGPASTHVAPVRVDDRRHPSDGVDIGHTEGRSHRAIGADRAHHDRVGHGHHAGGPHGAACRVVGLDDGCGVGAVGHDHGLTGRLEQGGVDARTGEAKIGRQRAGGDLGLGFHEPGDPVGEHQPAAVRITARHAQPGPPVVLLGDHAVGRVADLFDHHGETADDEQRGDRSDQARRAEHAGVPPAIATIDGRLSGPPAGAARASTDEP